MSHTDKSGVRKATGALTGALVVDTCHDILNTAATLLANLEFLTDAGMGSRVEREAAAADALDSIRKLADTVRHLQESARQSLGRAA